MKNITAAIIFVVTLVGCHSAFITRFDSVQYSPTDDVKVFSDITTVPEDYFEIGYVEAKGGLGVEKEELLMDMIEEAMKCGADALIKVEFFDRERYDRYIGTFEKPGAKAIMVRYKSHK